MADTSDEKLIEALDIVAEHAETVRLRLIATGKSITDAPYRAGIARDFCASELRDVQQRREATRQRHIAIGRQIALTGNLGRRDELDTSFEELGAVAVKAVSDAD